MSSCAFASNGPIGCAFTANYLRLAQIHTEKCASSVVHQVESTLASGHSDKDSKAKALSHALRNALERGDFVGDLATACLLPGRATHRHLHFATSPGMDLDSAAKRRLAQDLSIPVTDLRAGVFEYALEASSGPHDRDLLAIAAPEQEVEVIDSAMRDAGLTPHAVESPLVSIARCFAPPAAEVQRSSTAESVLVLYVEPCSIHLMIVINRMPRFLRSLPRTITDVCGAPAANAGQQSTAAFDRIDSLARQIDLTLVHLAELEPSAMQPERACLIGAGEDQSEWESYLSEHSSIDFMPARNLLPSYIRSLSFDGRLSPTDDWLLPLGLALYDFEHVFEERSNASHQPA